MPSKHSRECALVVMFFDLLIWGGWYAVAVPASAVFTRYIFNHKTCKREWEEENMTDHGCRLQARVNLNATRNKDAADPM